MEYPSDFSKDSRRNDRNKAKEQHFRSGKKQTRCHKDVVNGGKNFVELAENSNLGYKNRLNFKDDTLKLINGAGVKVFGTDYIKNTKYYPYDKKINYVVPKKTDDSEDSDDSDDSDDSEDSVRFLEQDLISFIWDIPSEEINKWVILNYPSPIKPAGGFDKDASIYEESLAICTCLYRSLSEGDGKIMYQKNSNDEEECIFDSDLIYSPNIPIFRDGDFDLIENWETDFSTISIITIPAINHHKYSKTAEYNIENYIAIMKDRIHRILSVALMNGHTKIALGPWGCGIDGGPLDEIITLFCDDELFESFKEVVFISNDEKTTAFMRAFYNKLFKKK
jgi:uncharacterized protein (TIGR02452 family)